MDLCALRVLLPLIRRCTEIILVVLVLSFTHTGLCDAQSFGYTYLTSDDETGPVYEWLEISDIGTTSSIDSPNYPGNIANETIPIGFPFIYDGDTYTSVVVFKNGGLFFSSFYTYYNHECIPSISIPNNFVSLYSIESEALAVKNAWGEYVYYQTLGEEPHRAFVVEWIGSNTWIPDPPKVILEAILFEGTGEILFQYKKVDEARHPYGEGTIIGLENVDGTDGLGYRCWSDSEPLVHNEMAILWTPTRGVFISPPIQRDYGYRGEEVRYRIRIKNQTGSETSFMMQVAGNRWDTVMYEDGTSIELTDTDIMPGNTAKYFEVGVRIPDDARIGFTDVVNIITLDILDASTTNSTTIETTAVSQWERMAPMPTARNRLAVERAGGKIYAIGGEEGPGVYSAQNECYNQVSDSWSALRTKPTASSNLASGATGEKIICCGGYHREIEQAVEVYDTLRDVWTAAESLPTTYTSGARGECLSETFYYIGGGSPSEYENSRRVFSFKEDLGWHEEEPLNSPRDFAASGVVGGKIYISGGSMYNSMTSGWLDSAEFYNRDSSNWEKVKETMSYRRSFAIGDAWGRCLFIGYGLDTTGSTSDGLIYLDSLERYGPLGTRNPGWLLFNDVASPARFAAGSCIAEVKGKYYLYVIGGKSQEIGYMNENIRWLIWDGNVRDYGFEGDTEGWTASGAPVVFDMPETAVGAEALELTAVNNTNCFGFWASATGAFDLEDEYIYRVRFVVSSDEVYKESIPRFRFRVGDGGFRFWSVSTHQSSADAHTLPDTVGTTYTLYFAPTDAVLAAPMVCAFDLLNFDPMDSANATLALKDVDIDFVPIEQTLNRAEKKQFTFDTSPEGWQFSGTIEPFDLPISSWQSSSIQMTALNNTNTFGYWFIELSDIQIKPYRLYLAEFTVSSDQSQARLVPSLRLRMSNHLFEQTSELVIPSGEDALLPLSDAPRTYRLYFSPLQSVYPREYWEELQGGTPPHLVLAFDLLGFDPDCATSATLSLHTVSLYTIDLNNL